MTRASHPHTESNNIAEGGHKAEQGGASVHAGRTVDKEHQSLRQGYGHIPHLP